uniref:Rhodanese domain-containing protein n=1 Tax=Chromera velia CCMP2878 TaxID=1169474 RepID=A0A0G4H6V2_9ALVE|eukprot:Cvel_5795.t1-p1 / transcript=Cvel_5795.t1 / gene=Cvel_5795 / organism=Chromera_velia_CCMP2878 / gene_product=hypothetical protein / transcript_product=hypothetical protein / location=Cvel_scaffold275:76390-81390(-) / protein_length=230 / sequence_SO=supercontig / SO=protein_coding / is_pseudo=false
MRGASPPSGDFVEGDGGLDRRKKAETEFLSYHQRACPGAETASTEDIVEEMKAFLSAGAAAEGGVQWLQGAGTNDESEETAEATRGHSSRASLMAARFAQEIQKEKKQSPGGKLRGLLSRGGPVLVDVRDEEERRVSVIPGSFSKDEFEREVAGLTEESQLKTTTEDAKEPFDPSAVRVVPYCTIGYRSGLCVRDLKVRGFTQSRNGEGVILWAHKLSHSSYRRETASAI